MECGSSHGRQTDTTTFVDVCAMSPELHIRGIWTGWRGSTASQQSVDIRHHSVDVTTRRTHFSQWIRQQDDSFVCCVYMEISYAELWKQILCMYTRCAEKEYILLYCTAPKTEHFKMKMSDTTMYSWPHNCKVNKKLDCVIGLILWEMFSARQNFIFCQ